MRARPFLLLPTLALLAVLLLCASSASAAPLTYDLTAGQITTVQFIDPSGAAVPCPIGQPTNCLANAPVAIDSGSITLDQGALVLADLQFHSTGPSLIVFGGAMGLDSMSLADATFQSGAPTPLTPSPTTPDTFSFGPVPGTITTDLTVTAVGGPSLFVPGYQIPSNPAGTIFVDNATANLNLVGVDLGTLCNPLDRSSCLVVKADFSFVANQRSVPVIPEPQAFLVFAAGALLVHSAVRRRRAAL